MKKTSLTRVSGLLAAALLLAACNNSPTNTISPANPVTPISTPASEATQPAAGSTADATSAPSGEASDPAADWNRVKSSGKLMVGSAIDYPPFSYYNPDFTVDGFDIAPYVGIAMGQDVQVCRDSMKPHLALYIGGMGARGKNFYNDYCKRLGYEAAAAKIQDAYLAGRRDEAIAAVPDSLIDETALIGPPERIKDRLLAWKEGARGGSIGTMLLGSASIDALRVVAEAVL